MIYNKKNYKILIYGEPNKWAMTYNLKESLQQLGHSVYMFDWTQWLYRTKQYSLKNRILDRILFHKVATKINYNFTNILEKDRYDLVIILKGIYLFPSTILAVKEYGNFVVNWNPDDFFNPLNNSPYLLKSFDKYDCIFTSRGHLIDEYLQRGAKRFEVTNWYYRPDIFYPMELSSEDKMKYGSDLVFFGSWSRRREEILWSLGNFNIRVFGGGWHKASKSFRKKIKYNPPVYNEMLCIIINSSKVNLNILTKENRDTTNIRNFEIPACAGFQLSERSNEILELFEEDKEIVCFETIEELISKCKYYLEHESEREKIRLNGYQRLIQGEHTMLDRAKQILNTIFD